VALKGYFDGGNEADSTLYKILTLASFSGLDTHWRAFDLRWKKTLAKYKAPYLHTTDAVCLSRDFSRSNGWNKEKVNDLISDCVEVIEDCAAIRTGDKISRFGIRPATVSVILGDFKKALTTFPRLGTVEHLCATQCVSFTAAYGSTAGARQFQLYFDQGEPFLGHIHDRKTNRKARQASPFWAMVTDLGESDMRHVPALQAADVLAWSVNHAYEEEAIRFDWQERILFIDREKDLFDYDRLQEPIIEMIDTVEPWKLPKRRASR
jgi:hypothetical protein